MSDTECGDLLSALVDEEVGSSIEEIGAELVALPANAALTGLDDWTGTHIRRITVE